MSRPTCCEASRNTRQQISTSFIGDPNWEVAGRIKPFHSLQHAWMISESSERARENDCWKNKWIYMSRPVSDSAFRNVCAAPEESVDEDEGEPTTRTAFASSFGYRIFLVTKAPTSLVTRILSVTTPMCPRCQDTETVPPIRNFCSCQHGNRPLGATKSRKYLD
jgi:hypothetical protein